MAIVLSTCSIVDEPRFEASCGTVVSTIGTSMYRRVALTTTCKIASPHKPTLRMHGCLLLCSPRSSAPNPTTTTRKKDCPAVNCRSSALRLNALSRASKISVAKSKKCHKIEQVSQNQTSVKIEQVSQNHRSVAKSNKCHKIEQVSRNQKSVPKS